MEAIPPPDTALLRVLDAAANRVREGLRVLEDYARFTADDRLLTERLKRWRHRLAGALEALDPRDLLAARDTRGDVGTDVHTEREQTRGSLLDVARAACKRVQEGARTLEEFGKLVSPEFAAELGALRYESYTLEKSLLGPPGGAGGLRGCRLYVLVTRGLCRRPADEVVRGALRGGAHAIQVREKQMADRELVEWARRVRDWTRDAGALCIINDRPDLAVVSGAEGVHVGQEELTVPDARRIVGPERLIGVSTHHLSQLRAAVRDGADYVGVGPVFPSGTKEFPELAGLDYVREAATETELPAFALGGINASNVSMVVAAGATRIAVSGAVCGAADPEQATRELLEMLPADDEEVA